MSVKLLCEINNFGYVYDCLNLTDLIFVRVWGVIESWTVSTVNVIIVIIICFVYF